MAKIAFIGLGTMGYPMAGHLAKAGHQMTVYNRTSSTADKWKQEFGGRTVLSPALAAEDADFVFSCVRTDDDLRSVAIGKDGAFLTMKKDAIYIDQSTVSVQVVRELYKIAKDRGFHFLDAPISGGEIGAHKGVVTTMVGGDNAIYARAEPVLKSFSSLVQHMGASSLGQLTKMVNQLAAFSTLQGLIEALNFAKSAGLDCEKVVDSISKGVAGSWFLNNHGKNLASGNCDLGFPIGLLRKDLGICLNEARRNGAPLPMAALIDQLFAEIQQVVGDKLDGCGLSAKFKR